MSSLSRSGCFRAGRSSLTLYANNQIDRNVFGFEVPTAWFQSLNSFLVLILASIMSALWYKLGILKRGDLKTPTNMALGLGIVLFLLSKPLAKLME
ncbi:POT-type proton-dependent oligopeptide transporter [Peribacillus simplex]|uniref:POT-type proton-dependent oligopeptide transporter n=1 Tax=Peribacillus simplex TaxID=1478 RepID=UPI0035D41A8A